MPDFVLKGSMRTSGLSSNGAQRFVPDGTGAPRARESSL
ncbi:MAG: hypothetical protein JWN05_1378 [Arthrobacter sp.]|jgi:hypothetical protein|nr:hypothetical protein [Arthrobacter sp.]